MTILSRIKAAFARRYRYRRADTGAFCSAEYARANPETTVRERVR